ncbi:MAG: hypothetical protein FJY10_00790 [Bacteroidetes bacterium]|nr:hypothetical protein [Bacteroidota bacterium]
MIYGIDHNGITVRAFPEGRAFCPNPSCSSNLIAKCGEFNIWHWAHENKSDCDSWNYEPITEWHISWQENFSLDRREVFIRKGNACHLADVVSHDNLVIEIQNSQILSTEIRLRENFYGKMIWVINSKEFKHNFILKDFRIDFVSEIWFKHIFPYHDGELDFAIIIPEDDDGTILESVMVNNYEKYFDTEKGKEFWARKRNGPNPELPIEIQNSYKGYLFNQLLKKICIPSKSHYTTFHWKSLRKSWTISKMPKFIDFNNGFLFYIKTLHSNGNGFGLIISKSTFLKKYQI